MSSFLGAWSSYTQFWGNFEILGGYKFFPLKTGVKEKRNPREGKRKIFHKLFDKREEKKYNCSGFGFLFYLI